MIDFATPRSAKPALTAQEPVAPWVLGRDETLGRIKRLMADGEPAFDFPLPNAQAHALVMRGVPPATLEPLGSVLGVGLVRVTEFLDIDRGTPARQAAKGKPLPRHASEGVLRLLEIEQMAFDAFEAGQSTDWLNKPHPLLAGQTPLQAASTSFGAEQVKGILVAIRYGGAV
jgi:putative toxin-antitoxin system antitoxin component (TIGR02293 family)